MNDDIGQAIADQLRNIASQLGQLTLAVGAVIHELEVSNGKVDREQPPR